MTQQYIKKAEVAAMFGVDVRSITTWQNDEIDPLPVAIVGKRGVPHHYDIRAVYAWGVRQELNKVGAGGDGETLYQYDKERARLTHEQANRAELEVGKLKGDLIPAEVVLATWTETIVNMRARLLALPHRTAHRVQAAEGLTEIREILTEATFEALEELSTDELDEQQLASVENAAAGFRESETTAEIDRQRME